MTSRCAPLVAFVLAGGLACAAPSVPNDVPEKAGTARPGAERPATAAPSGSAAPPRAKTLWRPIAPPRDEPVAPRPPVAPSDIRFTDIAGIRGEIDALRDRGRPVLVNYWATWCVPCMRELPLLGDLGREWGDDGPAILGVSLDRLTVSGDDPVLENVRALLARNRVSYPNRIVRGDQREVFEVFGIPGGIPFSVFYDGRGAVVRRFKGSLTIDELRAVSRSLAAGDAAGGPGG
jgi:thiol-disulfide isomerase/thioredoxin